MDCTQTSVLFGSPEDRPCTVYPNFTPENSLSLYLDPSPSLVLVTCLTTLQRTFSTVFQVFYLGRVISYRRGQKPFTLLEVGRTSEGYIARETVL